MALWISQELKLATKHTLSLTASGVSIHSPASVGFLSGTAYFHPNTREDANSMSVALKLAAKRLEEIGKDLQ